MSRPKVDEVLDFLSDWKSSREVKDEFDLTQSQWYNLQNWLRNGNFVKRTLLPIEGKTNTAYLYKRDDIN